MSNLYGSPSVKNEALDRTIVSRTATTAGRPKAASECNIGAIACYTNSGDNWPKTDIAADQFNVSLSKIILGSQNRAGVQDGDITALRYDNFWFAFNKEPGSQVAYNLVKLNQDVIVKNSSCYLTIGDRKAVITTRCPETIENEVVKTGFPEVGEFGITCNDGEFCYSAYKSVLFGANAVCDIKTGGKAFSALLFQYKNRLFLANFGFEPISVNGEAVNFASIALENGDSVTIHETTFTVRLPEVKLDALCDKVVASTLCLLDIESHSAKMEKIALPVSQAFSLGRGTSGDIVIIDKSISRKHAQLIVYEDHVLVMDCYSKNGTFINNKRTGKGRARIGDLITFADKSYLLGHYNG